MAERRAPPTVKPSTQTSSGSGWTWSSFSSWPLSVKFSPVLVAIFAAVLGVFFPSLLGNPSATSLFSSQSECVKNFNYTFQIARSKHHAETLSQKSWELGTTSHALLELITPEKTVFAPGAIRKGKVPKNLFTMDEAMVWLHSVMRANEGPLFIEDEGSGTDPASVGVVAMMVGQHWPGLLQAADRQVDFLLNQALRYENGAISHRRDGAELWADAISMFPPFLAFYGMAKKNVTLMRESVRQIGLYRDILETRSGMQMGLWRHIAASSSRRDDGSWSTGNGWAAYGMVRTRATISGWDKTRKEMRQELEQLDGWTLDLLQGVIRTDDDESGLLRNYLGAPPSMGEGAGTALLAAAAYRMVMFLRPSPVRENLVEWADRKRRVVAAHVDGDGVLAPVVNPHKHGEEKPLEGASPEAEAFLLMLGAAWRDCVCGGVCECDGGVGR